MARYTLTPDSGPDDERIWLTVGLPTLAGRPRLRYLRTVAAIYALAAELNGRAQQRFGLDVIAVRMDSDDGDISITFEFDSDFSDAYAWRDEIAKSAARIIVANGGLVDTSHLALPPDEAQLDVHHRTRVDSTPSTTPPARLRSRLLTILRSPSAEMNRKLVELKAKALNRAKRPTFIWDSLTQSFATMGNSRGWAGLVDNAENARRISYDVVRQCPPTKRLAHIDAVLRDAVVRMPAQKARYLVANFGRIESMGGVVAASKAAFDAQGRDAKLAFMQQFDGIGDKYARNIWMDVYHPDFHDAIAIDERIKKITATLGYAFTGYGDHERFYQEIARDAGMQPWELDRLLYHFNEQILTALSV